MRFLGLLIYYIMAKFFKVTMSRENKDDRSIVFRELQPSQVQILEHFSAKNTFVCLLNKINKFQKQIWNRYHSTVLFISDFGST